MTLEQLRIFVAVADRLHFTRAAAALGLTQSAVSAAVAALEAWSGIALFHRIGRRIELTAEGGAFLIEARAVLASAGHAKALIEDLSGLARGNLVVMGSQTVAAYWLPARLHRFSLAHPGITVALRIGNSADVAAAVLSGEAELGFVEGEVGEGAIDARVVGEDEMVLVVGGDHRTDAGRLTGAEALRRIPWVVREPGSGTRAACEALLASHGLGLAEVRVALELPSNEAVCAAVEAGAGATVLSRLIVANGLAAGKLAAVPTAMAPRRFSVLRHHERRLSRASRAFLDLAAG